MVTERRKAKGNSYVPDKWQALEVQQRKDDSEELPGASLACEAELATQTRRGRRHQWNRGVGDLLSRLDDAVGTVVETSMRFGQGDDGIGKQS